MRFILILLSFYAFANVDAQYTFNKQWDYRFGGYDDEPLFWQLQTSDGGYLMTGASLSSAGGDKSQDAWNNSNDFWIIRLNAAGAKLWDRRFGGFGEEGCFSAIQTRDGGFALSGYTQSSNSGDVTEPTRGGTDYWVVKIDGNGNKVWDKRFGGSGDDYFPLKILQTPDGGFVCGGSSSSDAGGDKSENSKGIWEDYWIVKLDSLGNKQWDKTYGGNDADFFSDIVLTKDEGYFIVGSSKSDSSGDKTQNNWGFPAYDYWVVKIDSVGNKQWDVTLGTNTVDFAYKCLQLSDGRYLVSGVASFGISGNKQIYKGGIWTVVLDSTGQRLGEFSFTGAYELNGFSSTADGGLLLSGRSVMDTSEDKTEFGDDRVWVIKLDSAFNKQWDKTIYSKFVNYGGCIETNDGCYAAGTFILGAGTGGYQTQPNWDQTGQTRDFWIVKFCMEDWNGISEPNSQNDIQIQAYPNPFTDNLNISLTGEYINAATFTLTDVTGKVIYRKEETNLARGYTKMLDLGLIPSGAYTVTVEHAGGVTTKAVVKK